MSIRIATFNMENLFRRPTAFRLDDPVKRKEILDDFATLGALLDLPVYTDDDKKKIAGAHREAPGVRRSTRRTRRRST